MSKSTSAIESESSTSDSSASSYYLPPVLRQEEKKKEEEDSEAEWDGSSDVQKTEDDEAIDLTAIVHIYGQRKIDGEIEHLVLWDDDMTEWISSDRLGLSRRTILALNQRNASVRRFRA